MPCDEDLWEATTAEEWKRLHDRGRQPIQFISALKASLTAVNETTSLNPFSRISVLHGLLSVAQDLQWWVTFPLSFGLTALNNLADHLECAAGVIMSSVSHYQRGDPRTGAT